MSFFRPEKIITESIPRFKNFMLDSGAFSFLRLGKRVDWDNYITKYIDFINTNNIKLFFELDIGRIIGYDRVKEIRRRLERETGKRPIPVWHKYLGKEEFLRMCDEYDYVAIGGFAIKDILPTEFKYIPWFIDKAHNRGVKIHGLGFTRLSWLNTLHFDSVDSTSWTTGNRFGYIFKFNGRTMTKIHRSQNTRVKNRETATNNFIEWLKFSDYAERYL